jgi:tripartite-type tricarboxylate transporter receptor subunit TctC
VSSGFVCRLRRSPTAFWHAAAITWVAALVGAAVEAHAQAYPNRAIRLIVPYAAGGGTDAMARAIGQVLTAKLGQTVVIENIGTAGGNVATQMVATAQPDGYTILMANQGPLAINPHLIKNFKIDTLKAFDPICLIAVTPLIAVVAPESPFKDFRTLVAYGRANPGKLTYGTAGTGSASHLAAILLNAAAGIETVGVSYRGAAPALTDLIGRRTDFMITPLSSLMGVLQSKTVLPLAAATKTRVAAFPEVPTIRESGVPDYDVGDGAWYGMVVPSGTPPSIIDALRGAIVEGLKEPLLAGRIQTDGSYPIGSTPEALRSFMKAESERWASAIRRAGISVD